MASSSSRRAAAIKAAQTRAENKRRKAQGLPPIGRGSSKKKAASATPPAQAPAGAASQIAQALRGVARPVTPAGTVGPVHHQPPRQTASGGTITPTQGGVSGRSAGLSGTAAAAFSPTAPDPNDPLTQQLRAQVAAVKPTWSNDGRVLRVWREGNPRQYVELPVEDEPGSYTPTEKIFPILGQPDMVFAVAVAIKERKHVLLKGPTGTGKTELFRWFAQELRWNLVAMPISRGTEAAHMVGEYLPTESGEASVQFAWTYGPVAQAVIESQEHPTILVFEEINRIGNVQEFARIYSLLDGTRKLELKEKRGDDGESEVLIPGDLIVGANMNPADDEGADYIGVQELDPALLRRFMFQPKIGYPPESIEAEALRQRVTGLKAVEAVQMVKAANAVRTAEAIRYPMSFPDLVAWATALPHFGWEDAAEIAVVQKAHPDYQAAIRNLVKLRPTV